MFRRLFASALLAALFICSSACPQPHVQPEPRLPSGFAHTISETSYEYTYSVAPINNGASTEALTLRVFLPAGLEDESLPFAIFGNTGSFTLSDSDDTEENRSRILPYIQAGMGAVIVKTRVQQNTPTEPGAASRGATTALGRAIDAIIHDFYRATKFVQSNPARDDWLCEPNWVFLGGGSSSGIGTMCAVIRWKDDLHVAGMINYITSFGADNGIFGINYVANVRTELGHTEAQYTNDFPPMCHFSIGLDDTLSLTTIPTLQSLLNDRINAKALVDGKSIVHLDPNDPPRHTWGGATPNHWLAADWDESTLTDADTLGEAVFNFVTSVLSDVEPIRSGAKFAEE